jgi:nucleotide-binding universal stress UspA family protein
MSKRIVVGLDGSPYAQTALDLAVRRAKLYKSTIIGITVVDVPIIEQISAGAQPGAMYITSTALTSSLNEAKEQAQDHIAQFRKICASEDITCEDVIFSGSMIEALLEEGKTSDIIIIGLKTFFQSPAHEDSEASLSQLLKHPTCPVLAVPKILELPQHIIIAYDGSADAARALKAYAYITPDLPAIYPVTLLCIDTDYEKKKFHLEKAALFLRTHGIEAEIVISSGKPAQTILSTAKERSPSLIILGSPVYKGISERLFGSVAEEIIRDGTIPIFAYH